MATATEQHTTSFHLSLNVGNLDRSIEFLQALLGVEPAKRRHDYAKFELDDPPLVLSLEPAAVSGRGALNHVGFRLADSAALVEAQRRLEAAGVATQREEGVECCYARQTKFWANDPDGTLWEIYVFEGDIEHRGMGQTLEVITPPATVSPTSPSAPVTMAHCLGQPFPEKLSAADGRACPAGAAAEVLLQGTLNAALDAGERSRILHEVMRVLRPGGSVLIHALTGSSELPAGERPRLPGPAAMVEHVPLDREVAGELEGAGFVGIHYAKFGAAPCFHYGGVEMRETKLLAYKPTHAEPQTRTVIYKGPFRELRDDAGRTFRRGERTVVDAGTCELLRHGPAADQLLFL